MFDRTVVLNEISPKIYHFEFNSEYLICSSLIRIQEHYESPKFRNKVFDLEEYMDYYASTASSRNFTYFQDVLGFNIPSYATKKFYDGEFDPLSRKEKKILGVLKDMEHPYYIIATNKSSKTHNDDLIHEISHGLFYVNKEYKRNVRKILSGIDLSTIEKWLKEKGYNKAVYFDECHAILMESAGNLSRCGVKVSDFVDVRRELKKNYNDHFDQINKKILKFKI